MSILSEFKTFVARGNVVDLAVGVVQPPPPPSAEVLLLTEIRDELRKRA